MLNTDHHNPPRRRIRRTIITPIALAVLATSTFSAPQVQASGLKCQGHAVTINGATDGVPAGIDDHGTDTLIVGTHGPDVILGTNGSDHIIGWDGDDIICGLRGNDVINGKAGSDRIRGGAGTDYIAGQDGSDHIYTGSGRDIVVTQLKLDGTGDRVYVRGNGALSINDRNAPHYPSLLEPDTPNPLAPSQRQIANVWWQ